MESREWIVLQTSHKSQDSQSVRQSNYYKIKSQTFNLYFDNKSLKKQDIILNRCYIFRCEGRRESGHKNRDGIDLLFCPSSDLLAEIFFTASAEIFLKTKQKYFRTAFKLR